MRSWCGRFLWCELIGNFHDKLFLDILLLKFSLTTIYTYFYINYKKSLFVLIYLSFFPLNTKKMLSEAWFVKQHSIVHAF